MKKALALIMAIAMIASLAVVSMAATQINPQDDATKPTTNFVRDTHVYTFDKTNGYVPQGTIAFGKTAYVMLLDADDAAVGADAVKGLAVSAKWEKGAEYVKSVEIVKVGNATHGYNYAIAFATQGSSLETVNVLGEVQVKGKSLYEADTDGDNKLEGQKATINYKFEIELDLGWASDVAPADNLALNDGDKVVYDFDGIVNDKYDVDFGGKVKVVSDVKNMKKVLFAYNETADEALLDAYVDADLVFMNCTGSFRRTATVTIDLLDTEYLYEVVDGALVAVDGEYDDWTEEFTFKTRTMGNYVISDTELVVEEVVAANPSTGAAA